MYLTELANHCIAVSDDLDFDIISALIRDELDIPVPFSNDDSILLVCCLENLYASFRLCNKRRVPRFINGSQAGWRDGVIDKVHRPLDSELVDQNLFYLWILTVASIANKGLDFSSIDPSMPVNYYPRIKDDLSHSFDFIFNGTWNDLALKRVVNFRSF